MGDLAISGSIGEKIAWARGIHEKSEKSWLGHTEVKGLLEDLRQALERSRSSRGAASLTQICRACEEVGGGPVAGRESRTTTTDTSCSSTWAWAFTCPQKGGSRKAVFSFRRADVA